MKKERAERFPTLREFIDLMVDNGMPEPDIYRTSHYIVEYAVWTEMCISVTRDRAVFVTPSSGTPYRLSRKLDDECLQRVMQTYYEENLKRL